MNLKQETENRKPIHDKKFEPETGNHKPKPEPGNRNRFVKKNFELETGTRKPKPDSWKNFFEPETENRNRNPIFATGTRKPIDAENYPSI